jgi:hypothetical protein
VRVHLQNFLIRETFPYPPFSFDKFSITHGGSIVLNDTVGIKVDTPDAMLEVSADGQTTPDLFMLSSNDNTDGDRFIVKNNGNVGIGTNTPQKKLHVKGYVQIDNSAQPPVGTLQTLQGMSNVTPLKVAKWLRIYVDGELYCIPLFECPGITLE